jgi:hypothetical protein
MGGHLSGVPSADTEGLRSLASLTSPAGMGPAYSLHCSVDGEQPGPLTLGLRHRSARTGNF